MPDRRPSHEELFLGMSDGEFNQWRHNPITAAYLLFLDDQVNAFRTAVADMVETGNLTKAEAHGAQIRTLRELSTLKLSDIHGFYRKEDNEGKDGA